MGEDLGGCLALQGLVRAVVIVVREVGVQLLVAVLVVGGGVEVDAFPFDRAPLAFDEGIVGGPAPPVAADATAGLQQGLLKKLAGKLAALVGVEDERGRVLGQRRAQD